MSGYKLVMLKEMLKEIGEEETSKRLSSFSCPLNRDVEKFIWHKAIEFEKQSLSSTYLVLASYKSKYEIAGYFTLAHKHFVISEKSANQKSRSGKATKLSKSLYKRIRKQGTYDRLTETHTVPAPLIGQLGRNFAVPQKLISGDELLKIACDKVWEGQRLFSGRVVYLECEDKPILTEFYESNGFVKFGSRPLDADEKDDLAGGYLVQMLKDLKVIYEG